MSKLDLSKMDDESTGSKGNALHKKLDRKGLKDFIRGMYSHLSDNKNATVMIDNYINKLAIIEIFADNSAQGKLNTFKEVLAKVVDENIGFTKGNASHIKLNSKGLIDFKQGTNSHLNGNKNAIDNIEKYSTKLSRGKFIT